MEHIPTVLGFHHETQGSICRTRSEQVSTDFVLFHSMNIYLWLIERLWSEQSHSAFSFYNAVILVARWPYHQGPLLFTLCLMIMVSAEGSEVRLVRAFEVLCSSGWLGWNVQLTLIAVRDRRGTTAREAGISWQTRSQATSAAPVCRIGALRTHSSSSFSPTDVGNFRRRTEDYLVSTDDVSRLGLSNGYAVCACARVNRVVLGVIVCSFVLITALWLLPLVLIPSAFVFLFVLDGLYVDGVCRVD